MSVIVPALLSEDEEKYKAAIEKVKPFAKRVHVDVSDGKFAPVLLVQPEQLWWPQEWEVDIHAMVSRPEDYVDRLIPLQPHLIIFHAEAEGDLAPVLEKVKRYGIKTGLALLRSTVPDSVADKIRMVDHVLIFSGDLGHYGGTASMMQLEKVRLIKAVNPNVEIGWDGGVNIDNAFTLHQGGVDVLNSGGAISNSPDPSGTYKSLVEEVSKTGVV